jgi:hypothetical protein
LTHSYMTCVLSICRLLAERFWSPYDKSWYHARLDIFQMSIQKTFSQKVSRTVFVLKRITLSAEMQLVFLFICCKGSLIISLILTWDTYTPYYIAVHKPLRVVTQRLTRDSVFYLYHSLTIALLLLTIPHIYSRLRIITHDCSHLLTIAHIYSKCLTYVLGHTVCLHCSSTANSRTLRIESNILLSLPALSRINQYVTGLLCFLETFRNDTAPPPPTLLPSETSNHAKSHMYLYRSQRSQSL